MTRLQFLKQSFGAAVAVLLPFAALFKKEEKNHSASALLVSRGKMHHNSFLNNCVIESRQDQDGPMFIQQEDGTVIARLDGYAIIPKEKYYKM